MISEAIIISGGKGVRLMPYTQTKPKALVNVGNIPLIERQVKWLVNNGIKHIVIASGWMSEKIEKWARSKKEELNVSFSFSKEEAPLGTGGAVKKATSSLRDINNPFIVCNVDDLNDIDIEDFEKNIKDCDACIALAHFTSPYGKAIIEKGKILKFEQKPILKEIWVSCGIYIFNPSILDKLPDIGMLETYTFPKSNLNAYKHSGKWVTVTNCKDVSNFSKKWESNKYEDNNF